MALQPSTVTSLDQLATMASVAAAVVATTAPSPTNKRARADDAVPTVPSFPVAKKNEQSDGEEDDEAQVKAVAEELLEQQRRRKVSHSAIERRRRQRINEKIAQLQSLVPECTGRDGLQMAFVLQKTIEYIDKLHTELGMMRDRQKILLGNFLHQPPLVQGHPYTTAFQHPSQLSALHLVHPHQLSYHGALQISPNQSQAQYLGTTATAAPHLIMHPHDGANPDGLNGSSSTINGTNAGSTAAGTNMAGNGYYTSNLAPVGNKQLSFHGFPSHPSNSFNPVRSNAPFAASSLPSPSTTNLSNSYSQQMAQQVQHMHAAEHMQPVQQQQQPRMANSAISFTIDSLIHK